MDISKDKSFLSEVALFIVQQKVFFIKPGIQTNTALVRVDLRL